MHRYLLVLLAVSAFAGPLRAQPLPQPWTPQFDGDLGDVIDYYNRNISDGAARRDMRDAVLAQRSEIAQALQWSNQRGFLIEHRVMVAAGPGGLNRRPLGKPVMHGVGSTPADALANSELRIGLEAPPAPYRLDPDSSFFVWVEPHKNWFGKVKLQPAEIPPGEGFAGSVRIEAIAKIADAGLARVTLEDHRSRLLEGMVQEMRRETANAQERLRLDQQYVQLRDQRERVRTIEENLQREIRRENRANALLQTLGELRTLVNVATLALQVEAALDNPPTEQLRRARTPDDVIRITDEYRSATRGRVETYRREYQVQGQQANQMLEQLNRTLSPKAPQRLRTRVMLCPNDHPGCP